MGELNARVLKEEARQLLQGTQPSARRIALIHAAAGVGLSLLLSVVNYLLSRQIDQTGGLGGMQLRTTLETVQTLLQYGLLIVMPVWQLGFVAAALHWSRGNAVTPQMLPQCFRKFWPAIRLQLMRLLLSVGLCFLMMQVGTLVYTMLPSGQRLLEQMLPLMENMTTLDPEMLADPSLVSAMVPYTAFCVALCALVLIPLEYRLRMAEFLLLEDPRGSAMASVAISFRLTHRNCFKLLRLDLRFWWYYLLQMLLVGVSSADLLLASLGIALPLSADAAYFVLYGVYALGTLTLSWYAASHVQTANALAYGTLMEQLRASIEQPPREEQPKFNWDYET